MRFSIKKRRVFHEYQPLLHPLAVFTIILAGSIFGIIPAVRATWNLIGEQSAVQKEIALLNKKISVLRSLDSESLKKDLSELFAAIPTDKSIPTLFATLEAASGQAGVGLLDVTLSAVGTLATESAKQSVTHPSGARVVQFSASVEGTMAQMQEFFRLAGTVRRLMGIRNFDMTVTSPQIVQTKLEMDTYFSPLPKELGGIAKELTAPTSEEESVISKVASLPNLSRTIELPPPAIGAIKSDPFAP